MEKVSWIKELVRAEQQMEESGMIDLSSIEDQDRMLAQETLQLLLRLKTEFVDASTAFNELKPSPLGRLKVYGIAKTHADFMLFRNGFKMIFSLKTAGQIAIRFNFIGTHYLPGQSSENGPGTKLMDEQIVEAKWGPFGDLRWTYLGETINVDAMIRYYMTQFLRESAK